MFNSFSRNRRVRNCLLGVIAALASSPTAASASEPIKTGEILVQGNEKTKTYIILREIPLRTGDPFSSKKVDEARKRLSQIPGIDYSEIRTWYSSADSSFALTVVVTEKSTFRALPSIRRGYENLMSFGGWAADDNFRGRGEMIGASAMFRGGTAVSAAWVNPWLGRGLRIGVGVAGDYLDYRYVYDDLGGVFEGTRIQSGRGDVSLIYTFGSGMQAFARLGYRRVDGDRPGSTIEPEGDRFGTVTAGVRYDASGSRLFPWSGWFLRAEATSVGPGDDAYSIFRGVLDARAYLPVLDRTVFAVQFVTRVNEGDDIPIYMRNHLGGGLTIRGYDYGTFNGASSAMSSAEYRIPINFSRDRTVEDLLLTASLHLFADVGATWELDQTPDAVRWNSGFGVGILLASAWFRGVRFDYGWNRDSEGRFDFEIGIKF